MRPHKRDPGTVYLTVIINTEMTVAGTAEQCNSSQSRHTIQRFIQSLPHARHFDGCLYTAARYRFHLFGKMFFKRIKSIIGTVFRTSSLRSATGSQAITG